MTFYDINFKNSIWVGLFSFVGAPTIYQALNNQNIITYKPTSLSDTISISKENEIRRDK